MRYFITACLLLGLFIVPGTALGAKPMPWIIDAPAAQKLVDSGATLLDARSSWAYTKGHLDGAVHIKWDDFTPSSKKNRGELLASDSKLAKLLAKHGVETGRPVVVVDDPKDGWGEAGRIVWMLRALGHEQAAWVDGGHRAMVDAGRKTTIMPVKAKASDGVKIKRNAALGVGAANVKKLLGGDAVLIDTREKREFDGRTPYGESRGGHLPGAQHVWFKDLLQKDGTLKPKSEIAAILSKHGIKTDTEVVAYCTGGVRSGWFIGVLQHLGYANASNYAGSMWQWSSGEAEEFPLE